jgi:hypothetical protein
VTTKAKLGRGSITIDDERLATETFEFDGDIFTMRELTTHESDEAWDAALEPVPGGDKGATRVNSRVNTRLLLTTSMIDPVVTVDRVDKWGGRKYGTILRVFNRLNSIDGENPTPPAGSAGPTPPAGGEPSPQS